MVLLVLLTCYGFDLSVGCLFVVLVVWVFGYLVCLCFDLGVYWCLLLFVCVMILMV